MVRVKVCGITNLEDAFLSEKLGANELGFNFFRGSRRYVSPEKAREIVDQLSTESGKVGVFVNEQVSNVAAIADLVGLTALQIHGDENKAYFSSLRKATDRSVIKAFRVTPTFDIATALDWHCDFPLFDSFSPDEYGGTGTRFARDNFLFHINLWLPGRAYIAGGLTPDNVAEVIREAVPYAVDVASGVESAPGKKDPKKLEAFIRNAKTA